MEPIVESRISANCGVLVCCTSCPFSFKTRGTKTTIDPDNVFAEIFPSLETSCSEITFKFYANLGLS